ncbi:MAG: ABC transporter substrate-binding protein [Archaeoglobaceae archaeon]
MLKGILSVIASLLIVCSASALTIVDSARNVVEIEKVPERIVCLNPHCAEAIMLFGAKDKIVGLSTQARKPYLPNVTDVGNFMDPNIEAIIALNPDLVITYAGPGAMIVPKEKLDDKLRGTGIKVVRLNFYKLETVFDEIITLGKILGKEKEAEELVKFWESQLGEIVERAKKVEKRVRVYWETYPSYTAVGKGGSGDDIIKIAGGYNVFGNETLYVKTDVEKIVAKNPEVVIKITASFQPYGAENITKLVELYREFISRPEMSQIDAGKNGRIYLICSDLLFANFGLVVTVAYVSKILYPDLFEDLDPKELHRKYVESLGLEYKGVWVYPELPKIEKPKSEKEEKTIPGFEFSIAISAIASLILLRRVIK